MVKTLADDVTILQIIFWWEARPESLLQSCFCLHMSPASRHLVNYLFLFLAYEII
jgi:hypothetical protein